MANHEAAIQSLTDSRNHWLGRIETAEKQIDAHKENINRLRDEKEAAIELVQKFERSIEALKASY